MPIAKINKVKSPALIAFGEAIRQRRKALGYSQEAFGDACGIDRSYMGGSRLSSLRIWINLLKLAAERIDLHLAFNHDFVPSIALCSFVIFRTSEHIHCSAFRYVGFIGSVVILVKR
jgi:transcriptional regulator with XRE-family HTH domain